MAITITDKYVYKKLVAAGYNAIWYESSMGTMTKLAASDGDIDTSDQLMLFEAFQKVFVVNGAKLKVADFVNTKLTHTTLTTAHAHGDILTQATSNAVMVVDFTDSTKTNTYGYVTSGTFNATNQVTGNGSGTAFTPTAVTSNPHWYNWTVYPGGSFGSMPATAYLGCLYRGRLWLSGNSNYPYMWYSSRQANPWDWLYTANDPQSPIAGQDSDAGELGDIIKALIPYRDEYLVFGCANSIWVLKGDPAITGTIQEVDLTKGMFGAKSWCFDGDGNLYFASMNGFHVLPAGFGPIKDLSAIPIPQFISTQNVDPTIHRIVMEYDRKRNGILISITTIATGANSNYWYDVKTQGFFPESYDSTCGAYSLFFYEATDDAYRELLVGSTDGYIRNFDESTKNDTTTASTSTIDSHVLLPIIQAEDEDKDVKLTSLLLTVAGGLSSGDFTDSDDIDIELYRGKDAESVVEDVIDGATPMHTKSIALGSGYKNNKMVNRIRGHAIGIRLRNSTASETWAVERVSASIEDVRS